ncbi:MAG TPA: FGGY-family carbohydrate kinase, partial [Sediminibacterium sp.]|nr:FGGY-family carbohydrate kinase [Sediminibacterium sp.]
TQHLFTETFDAAQAAGTISAAWAERLGLPGNVKIGIGAFDCHMGAVGGQIEPYHLSKVMGTSTCDMLVAPLDATNGILVKGICGQVPGSIIPGMLGMEAGQSAFGDAYAWFSKLLLWPFAQLLPDQQSLLAQMQEQLIPALAQAASALPVTENDAWALDWLNGRRTPDANQELKGMIGNLNLGTDAPRVFRAIAEATCFGARAIVERFREEGIPVKGLIGLGGVAKKSPYIMQMMADILQMPIRIHKSDQTCALGAAMFAATAAGIYQRVEDAMQAMGPGFEKTYQPDPEKAQHYEKRYRQYCKWGGYATANSQ